MRLTLFREGDNADPLFVLREGRVALQMMLPKEMGETARRVTNEMVAKNEAFGWSAIVEPHLYTLTAVSLQNIKVLSIIGTQLRQLIQENSEVAAKILKELIKVVSSRLRQTHQLLVSERSVILKT